MTKQGAKKGFNKEKKVLERFVNYKTDILAQKWLRLMGYDHNEIVLISGKISKGKRDVSLVIRFKTGLFLCPGLQVKLISGSRGFNQLDKRWVDKYEQLWNIPSNIVSLLKMFTGEILHGRVGTKTTTRLYMDEMKIDEQNQIISFFSDNKGQIVNDLFRGRNGMLVSWFLVIEEHDKVYKYSLLPIEMAIAIFSEGQVYITVRGSLRIGSIGMQRKGGDSGKKTANQLQFKIDPSLVLRK